MSRLLTPELIWINFDDRVGEYFTLGEVCNYETARLPKVWQVKRNICQLAQRLDTVRRAWGSPIGVTSWYRPPEINRAVGGVPDSQHLHGSAADIFPIGRDGLEFERWLDRGLWKDRALGYGQKSGRGFTHVDLRPGRIRWDY